AAQPLESEPTEYVEIQMIGEEEPREIPRPLLTEIIGPRMEELFRLLREHIERAARDGVFVSTCVLSGGGAQLTRSVELAQSVLGMPVRVGRPREVIDPRGLVASPVYATAVGLLTFAAQRVPVRKVKEPRSLPAAAWRLLASLFARVRRRKS
ncbi:MAG TPA: cell division FtsA domain-containing protein, partial [Armatimonadota bacterium]|nr:cell division FtsA domain-containing protein [Armatimonadota bacterium]